MDVDISGNGTLVYRAGGASAAHLVAVDRRGVARPLGEENDSRPFLWPRISPDGRRIAVTIGPPYDIWTYDLASKTLTRLTTDGNSYRPEWSRDGQRIAHVPAPGGTVRWQPWDGSGAAEAYLEGDQYEVSIGPSGSYLVVRRGSGTVGSSEDIWIAPIDSARAVRPFVATAAVETHPHLSPDGRLLAYVTDESGRREVYVRPLPGPGPRVQVSTTGGEEPMWSPDGRELFYRGPGQLMAAAISRTPELAVTQRTSLFADPYVRHPGHATYDVLPGGEFLMLEPVSGSGAQLFTIINWFEGLRRRTQGGIAGR